MSSLRINLSQVREKLSVIERVMSTEFWDDVTVHDLEQARQELRGIIQFRQQQDRAGADPKIVDVVEDESQIERKRHKVRLDHLDGLDMAAYRNRVTNVLQGIIDQSETLQKIKQGQPVSENDLEDLCSLVLTQEPGLDLHDLEDARQDAHAVEVSLIGLIDLCLTLGDNGDVGLFGRRLLDERDGLVTAHLKRDDHLGEEHRVTERKDGENQVAGLTGALLFVTHGANSVGVEPWR